MLMLMLMLMLMIVIDASSWMSMGAKQEGTISGRQKVKKVKLQIGAIRDTLHIANHSERFFWTEQ